MRVLKRLITFVIELFAALHHSLNPLFTIALHCYNTVSVEKRGTKLQTAEISPIENFKLHPAVGSANEQVWRISILPAQQISISFSQLTSAQNRPA